MKPDYNIGARNGLLDAKHLEALGMAIWLYLWFLDKQPKDSDKVLGGRPITYQLFAQSFPSTPRRTYVRWLSMVKDGGYISLIRTPRGLVVTINKSKKWLKSDAPRTAHRKRDAAPKTAHQEASDVPKMGSDAPEMAHAEDVPKTGIQYKRDSLYLQETTNNNTNVLGAERRGKPEINEMFDYWATEVGYSIESKIKSNRNACSNLLKKCGQKKLQQLIRGVAMAQSDQYAPRISDFITLQSKTNDLILWGRKKGINNGQRAVDLTN